MYSIWINRRVDTPPDETLPVIPDAIIKTLAELPGLLRDLELDLR
jgi:FMN phosphatase YigB (HAD superfamily)